MFAFFHIFPMPDVGVLQRLPPSSNHRGLIYSVSTPSDLLTLIGDMALFSVAFVRAGLAMRTLVWRSPIPGVFLETIPLTALPLIWIAFIIPYQSTFPPHPDDFAFLMTSFLLGVGNIFMLLSAFSLFASLMVFVFGSRFTRLPMGNHRAYIFASRLRIIFLSLVAIAGA